MGFVGTSMVVVVVTGVVEPAGVVVVVSVAVGELGRQGIADLRLPRVRGGGRGRGARLRHGDRRERQHRGSGEDSRRAFHVIASVTFAQQSFRSAG
jgi:hypothetical protein